MTKAVMIDLQTRIQEIRDELAAQAGLDPLMDRYRSGAIAGYNDLLNISFDEVSND